MLDGPYPPRVIANKAGEGSRGVDIDDYPSVQRIGTQWGRVATPPTAAPSAVPVSGLQLSSPTPCGIPWNRLYSSSIAPRAEGGEDAEVDRKNNNSQADKSWLSNVRSWSSAAAPLATTPLVSSPLYRPSTFAGNSTSLPMPPPSQPTGAPATVTAFTSASGHHYHADESVPGSRPTATEAPVSVLSTSSAVGSHRYQQLAAEHRYGSALPALSPSRHSHSLASRDGAATSDAASERTKETSLFHERSTRASRHNGFRERGSARNSHRSSFSGRNENADDSMGKDKSDHIKYGNDDDDDVDRPLQVTSRTHHNLSRQERSSSSATAEAAAASNVTVAANEEKRQRPGSRGSSLVSSQPHSREGQRFVTPSSQRRRSYSQPTPRPHASLRTAQWAVKLIDELVAQVAVQQASSTTGPLIVSSSLSATRTSSSISRRGSRTSGGNVVGTNTAQGNNNNRDASVTTVADLTTSFLSSRYGALQWRPMLQEFAVCLHRFHHLSPACAVFREYFIHVDADTLSDFQLFCRLFAAADIPRCSSVEARRVALHSSVSNSRNNNYGGNGGVTHTIVARRYVEVREVADCLQRMLQRVVLLDTAPCVVVGEHVGTGRALPPNSARRYGGRAGVQYRYVRGPPTRTASVPRRRRLSAEEVRAVKKVVVAWVEDSIEAERIAMKNSEGEVDEYEEASRESGPSSLRRIAFDRPGLVDAYALLQAALEAVKLLCSSSSSSSSLSRHERFREQPETSSVDYYEDEGDEYAEENWREPQGFRRPLPTPSRNRQSNDYDAPWQDSEPSYRQPRPAAAATAAAVAVHRAPDGRLWSPPRDGVVRGVRNSEGEKAQRRSSGARRSPPRRPSSVPLGGTGPQQQQQQQQQQGNASYDEWYGSADEGEARVHERASPWRASPSPSRQRPSSQGGPPPSPTSSPTRYQDPEQNQARNQLLQHSPLAAPSPSAQHPYIADLHAERRWQQVQRQVAAAERRDACWRQHPRMQARVQQQQQSLSPHVGTTATLAADTSAVEATIADIDRELRRRERSRGSGGGDGDYDCGACDPDAAEDNKRDRKLSTSQPHPASPQQKTREAMRLRDLQEFANRPLRLAPPPEMTHAAMRTAATPASYPSRILPTQKDGQGERAMRTQTSNTMATSPFHTRGRISVEQVTPPASAVSPRAFVQSPREAHSNAFAGAPVRVPATVAAAAPPPLLPSAGLRFTKDTTLSKDTVFLTNEEQAMLDQLETALRRLDSQHRRDHAAASSVADGGLASE